MATTLGAEEEEATGGRGGEMEVEISIGAGAEAGSSRHTIDPTARS